jgi:hypothetical protein
MTAVTFTPEWVEERRARLAAKHAEMQALIEKRRAEIQERRRFLRDMSAALESQRLDDLRERGVGILERGRDGVYHTESRGGWR